VALAAAQVAAWFAPAEGSFLVYGTLNGWRTDVGPSIARRPADFYSGSGQLVDPEVWSDVGVHLVSSGPLTTAVGSVGMSIRSGFGQSFEVRWDEPITALWYRISAPTGSVGFFRGDQYLGWLADGQLGVISTEPFDRLVISVPDNTYYGYLYTIEWGVVPGPGGAALLALGAPLLGARRRRAA
jgi:hypothetical protein